MGNGKAEIKEEHLLTDSDDRSEHAIVPTVPDKVRKRGVRKANRKTSPFKREYVVRNHSIGWQVKMYREFQGMTTGDLAEASGISSDNIKAFEDGDKNLSLPTLQKLLRRMDLKLAITPA